MKYIIIYLILAYIIPTQVIRVKRIYGDVTGIAIAPFLVLVAPSEYKTEEELIKHEKKHVQQQRRMGWIPFYFVYFYNNYKYGYYNNPLEIEARKAEKE